MHLQWRWHVDGRKDRQRCTVPSPTSPRSAPLTTPRRPRRRTRLVRRRCGGRGRRRGVRERAAPPADRARRPHGGAGRTARLRAAEWSAEHPRHDDAVGEARLVRPRDHRERERQGDPVHAAAPCARGACSAAQAHRQLVPVPRRPGVRPAQGAHRRGARPRRVGARPADDGHPAAGRALVEFDQLADETSHDERWQAIAAGLLGATPPADTPVPDTVQGELRPYQHAGYAWLSFLRSHGVGGVLADDMGLGKTLQVLAMIAAARAEAPSGARSSSSRRPRSSGTGRPKQLGSSRHCACRP